MLRDEPNLEQLLRTLQADTRGTILVSRLTSYLKTLPQDSLIGMCFTQLGQEWYLSLSLSDLYLVQSGSEQKKTRPISS